MIYMAASGAAQRRRRRKGGRTPPERASSMAARDGPERTVFTVSPHDGGWAVEHDGMVIERSPDKEVAKAAANKRARAAQDAGQPCKVLVWGERY
jgi:hypothetical protein